MVVMMMMMSSPPFNYSPGHTSERFSQLLWVPWLGRILNMSVLVCPYNVSFCSHCPLHANRSIMMTLLLVRANAGSTDNEDVGMVQRLV